MPPPSFAFSTCWTACDAAFVMPTLLSSRLGVEVGPSPSAHLCHTVQLNRRTFAFIRRWGTILCPSWCGLFCCLAWDNERGCREGCTEVDSMTSADAATRARVLPVLLLVDVVQHASFYYATKGEEQKKLPKTCCCFLWRNKKLDATLS